MTQNEVTYHRRSAGHASLSWPTGSGLAAEKTDQGDIWQWSRQTIEVLSGGKDCPLYYCAKRAVDIVLAFMRSPGWKPHRLRWGGKPVWCRVRVMIDLCDPWYAVRVVGCAGRT
jgi:hypothetical protein